MPGLLTVFLQNRGELTKVSKYNVCNVKMVLILSTYLGDTLALAGAVPAGAAATLLQVPALVQLGAVCRGVALPGLLHAVVFDTEAVVWAVSIL